MSVCVDRSDVAVCVTVPGVTEMRRHPQGPGVAHSIRLETTAGFSRIPASKYGEVVYVERTVWYLLLLHL